MGGGGGGGGAAAGGGGGGGGSGGRLLATKEWAQLFYYYYYSFPCNNIKNVPMKFLVSNEVLSQRSLLISIIRLLCSDTSGTV